MFETLPGEKQGGILERAKEILAERGVPKPGYFLEYFPGQRRSLDPAYLSNAMAADYRHKVEGSPRFRRFIIESIEGSLKRVGTDYFDILMCPHGANTPEELDTPEIYQTFLDLEKQGKVRFLGVTANNELAGMLRKAVDLGQYELAMIAYNLVRFGYVEAANRHAVAQDVDLIAMIAA